MGINPPGGMRTKSSLEGRTIFKECSKKLSVSSPGHRGPTGSERLTSDKWMEHSNDQEQKS